MKKFYYYLLKINWRSKKHMQYIFDKGGYKRICILKIILLVEIMLLLLNSGIHRTVEIQETRTNMESEGKVFMGFTIEWREGTLTIFKKERIVSYPGETLEYEQ